MTTPEVSPELMLSPLYQGLGQAMPTPRRLPINLQRPLPTYGRRYVTAPTPPARRSVVDSALIAVAGLSITGFLLYKSQGSSEPMDNGSEGGQRSSFTVPVVEQ